MKANKYQNLKIAITDEVQLKAVCDVLESMEYVPLRPSASGGCVYTWDDGLYCVDKDMESKVIYKTKTLTDLLAMRDKQFMEQLNAADCCREENKFHLEKIDELQAKIDELQARVDKVVHILTYTNHASTPLCNELRDILKGNKDEN